MIITRPGQDIISVEENVIETCLPDTSKKIHIIRLDFEDPTEEKMDVVMNNYPLTNRFVIKDNIKFYNWFFKTKNKKYYVENPYNVGIFSFFKKNNKILLNFHRIRYDVKKFLIKDHVFRDILRNLEIIEIDDEIFEDKQQMLSEWNGNVIVS